jgi:acyl-CoA synthetase (AMP-forming)/AMP-acid ligase II
VDVLQETATKYADEPALDDGHISLSYRELLIQTTKFAARLTEAGIRPGDRVGVRISSGHNDLYVAILGTMQAGAAYVPVDADDPDERAELVFGEADVAATVGDELELTITKPQPAPIASNDNDNADGYYDYPYSARMDSSGTTDAPRRHDGPEPTDDAWIIFTSGSTGVPKGVAVTHRSAAAFVDAEARAGGPGARGAVRSVRRIL